VDLSSGAINVIGLFFEVTPIEGHAANYFEMAAALRPELEKNGGLLFIDRYRGLDRSDVVLSHSWWETEYDLVRWRQNARHQATQRAGRDHHFKDYRIRIGRLIEERDERSAASRAAPPAEGDSDERQLWVSYLDERPASTDSRSLFKSVYREGKFLLLDDRADTAGKGVSDAVARGETRGFAIFRDYGMFMRREAPQHYPPVNRR
jgi:heme-degrading monooxygenase HmoA